MSTQVIAVWDGDFESHLPVCDSHHRWELLDENSPLKPDLKIRFVDPNTAKDIEVRAFVLVAKKFYVAPIRKDKLGEPNLGANALA